MATSTTYTKGYQFEFISEVSTDYLCKRCQYVAREPNTTTCCEQSFCEVCLNKNRPCPSCKQEGFKWQKNEQLKEEILALTVHCSMKDQGCNWTGQLKHFKAHFAKDCYYILKCPNECGATFERGDLEDHMKVCGLELVECEFSYAGCKEEFMRDKQQEHMELNTQKHLALMATALKHQQQKLLDMHAQERSSQSQQRTQEDQSTHYEDESDTTLEPGNENKAERTKQLVKKNKQKIKMVGVVSHTHRERIWIYRIVSCTNIIPLFAPIALAVLLALHFQSVPNTDKPTHSLDHISLQNKLEELGLEIIGIKEAIEQIQKEPVIPSPDSSISRLEDQIRELKESIKDSILEIKQNLDDYSSTIRNDYNQFTDDIRGSNQDRDKKLADTNEQFQTKQQLNEKKLQELTLLVGGMDSLTNRVSSLEQKIIELSGKILLLEQKVEELKNIEHHPPPPPHHHHPHHHPPPHHHHHHHHPHHGGGGCRGHH